MVLQRAGRRKRLGGSRSCCSRADADALAFSLCGHSSRGSTSVSVDSPAVPEGRTGRSMKIGELLDAIRKQALVVPEFQREYIWTRDQAKQSLVSLYKD